MDAAMRIDIEPDDTTATASSDFGSAAGTLITHLVSNFTRLLDDVGSDSQVVSREWHVLWADLQGRAAMVGRALRATPRFVRITSDLMQVTAGYRFHASVRERTTSWLGDEVHTALLQRLHEQGADRLYRLCVELRGGVLKLGQFISTRMDLLPEVYVSRLSRLQDRVPAVPAEQVIGRIEAELEAPIDCLYSEFDSQPLAAASLAQVHSALLPDGTRVAVKVLVPGIEEIVETDLAALQVSAPLMRDLLPLADLETVFLELARSVRQELDYRQEASNATAFAECFRSDAEVIIPSVHDSHSTANVLTLEYVEGQRLLDFLDDCEARGADGEAERDRLLGIMLRAFCEQVLVHGLFHADPHPGNFLVVRGADGPRLAVLDFGNVQRYSPSRRRAYAELGLAILTSNSIRMAELLAELGFRSRDGSPDSLNAFADLLLEAFREGVDPYAIDPRERLERVLELTRDNPVAEIPSDFVQLGRVFASLGGLLMRYRPNLSLYGVLMPCLSAAFAQPAE